MQFTVTTNQGLPPTTLPTILNPTLNPYPSLPPAVKKENLGPLGSYGTSRSIRNTSEWTEMVW
jgi:hypothetical protein